MEASGPPSAAPERRLRPARPPRPTQAREAVTAVEEGRGAGKERHATPHPRPSARFRRAPLQPQYSGPGRFGPLAAPQAQAALRAFPPTLCVQARGGRNTGTRAALCACARGWAARLAGSPEWALFPVAPPLTRPSAAISCSGARAASA